MSEKLKRIQEVTSWHSKLEPCKCYLCFMLEQLALSTEREGRYRRALEEITKLNTEGVTKASIIARQALSSSPAPEPVTVEELEEKAYFALANYDSSKEACYLENFDPYRNRTAQAKAVIAYLLSAFTITRKP